MSSIFGYEMRENVHSTNCCLGFNQLLSIFCEFANCTISIDMNVNIQYVLIPYDSLKSECFASSHH